MSSDLITCFSKPFFSIIIPIYNLEDYVEKTVITILRQSFTRYEIILVDDGSDDNSSHICDQLGAQNENITVLHKENGGSSDARNAAISIAKGDYLVFVDGDDELLDTHALSILYSRIEKFEEDVILYGFLKQTGDRTCTIRKLYDIDLFNLHDRSSTLHWLIQNNCMPYAPWVSCVRRRMVVEKGLRFKTGVSAEDFDWALQILNYAQTIGAVNENLYLYRARAGSISTKASILGVKGLSYAIEHWLDTLNRSIELDPYLPKIYVIALMNYSELTCYERAELDSIMRRDARILQEVGLCQSASIVRFAGPYVSGKMLSILYKFRSFLLRR